MQIRNLKRPRWRLNSSDILPISVAGLAISLIILSSATIWLAVSFSKLANQKPPTLVQQVDGRAFTVRPETVLYREPEVIRRTISDWAVMTLTWGKPLGAANTTIDEGKPINSKRDRIPTSSWEASFLLAPDFRDIFLQQLAADIVPQSVFAGQSAAVLVPQNFSVPEIAGQGRWKLKMIATRIVFDDATPAGRSIPFNRIFFVRAIPPPQNPLPQTVNDYQRIVYSLLERGIQIEEIRPLEREEKR